MSTENTILKITKMLRASYLSDGSEIQMVFPVSDSKHVTLSFSPKEFGHFVGQAARLVSEAQTRKLSKGDHFEVHVEQVAAAAALATTGGGRVILALRVSEGYPLHFALTPAEADQLRLQISEAVQKATAQSSQSRH